MSSERVYDIVTGEYLTEEEARVIEVADRELIVECYSRMKGIADTFTRATGNGTSAPRNPHDMTNAEMLREMNGALEAVEPVLNNALKQPVVAMMLKRFGG